MAQDYVRQSSFVDGDIISASLFNNEYNQLVNAFNYSDVDAASTGHRHDGTAGQGGNIFKIGDLDFLNKIEVDDLNNRWGVFVEVGGVAVEQVRIQDGAVVPVTDNDIDLGSASVEFKNLYLDGTANVDSLVVDETATITGAATFSSTLGVSGATTLSSTLGVTGATTLSSTLGVTGAATLSSDLSVGGNLTVAGNATISGNLTFGDADTDTVSFVADVNSNILPDVTNTYDLGSSSKKWRNLYVVGTAEIGSLSVTLADINGGTIDDTIIGATTAAAITGTTLKANTSLALASGVTVTSILDEDNLGSNSATAIPTQQSVKAYVDGKVFDAGDGDGLAFAIALG